MAKFYIVNARLLLYHTTRPVRFDCDSLIDTPSAKLVDVTVDRERKSVSKLKNIQFFFLKNRGYFLHWVFSALLQDLGIDFEYENKA